MKRWLLIVALLGVGIVGWTVPRGTPPGGCVGVLLYPDSAYVRAASCDGLVDDTVAWKAPSLHRRCIVRLLVNVEARSMEVARAECEGVRPATTDNRRVALHPIPEGR